MSNHVYYLEEVFYEHKRNQVLFKIIKDLKVLKEEGKVNCIVAQGNSSLVLSSIVSFLIDLPLVIVRKSSENCHSSNYLEYPDNLGPNFNYVFIDDLISSGATIEHVNNVLTKESEDSFGKVTLVKIYLYHSGDLDRVYALLDKKDLVPTEGILKVDY